MSSQHLRLVLRLLPILILVLAGCPGMLDGIGWDSSSCYALVRCSDGTPVTSATVKMLDDEDSLVAATSTDAAGRFCVGSGIGATNFAISKDGFRSLGLSADELAIPQCLAEFVCTPSQPAPCTCPDGGAGQADCLENGTSLGSCTGCP